MKKLIEDIRDDFDYILLDCPAGIEQGFQNAIAGADRSIVVTTPEVSAIRDADRILGLLEASGIRKNELLINRLRIDMVKRGDMMSVDDVTEILAVDLLGVIPDDEQVVIATNQGEPVVGEDSLAGRSYMNICRRLLGEDVPMEDYMKPEGFLGKLSSPFSPELGGNDDECTICFCCERETEESVDFRTECSVHRMRRTDWKRICTLRFQSIWRSPRNILISGFQGVIYILNTREKTSEKLFKKNIYTIILKITK